MTTQHEDSRKNWTSAGTLENINSGCLQRIADACELMAKSHDSLVRDRDWQKGRADRATDRLGMLENSLRSHKGQITKLRKKIAAMEAK
jgi:hypothetical protein